MIDIKSDIAFVSNLLKVGAIYQTSVCIKTKCAMTNKLWIGNGKILLLIKTIRSAFRINKEGILLLENEQSSDP